MSKPVSIEIGKRYKFCIKHGITYTIGSMNIDNIVHGYYSACNIRNGFNNIIANNTTSDMYFSGTVNSIGDGIIYLDDVEYLF